MEKQRPAYLRDIPPQDWEKTPASVKKLVEEMVQGVKQLEKQVSELEAVQQQVLEKVILDIQEFIITTIPRPPRI